MVREAARVTGPYLTFFPQFCREPLNDGAWYPGFTDWDLIKRLPPGTRERFTPAAGYYDLATDEAIAAQFNAIRGSAWPNIALYHYFFDGRFVLSAVERYILRTQRGVPRFFMIWANETWTKRWVGRPSDIIIKQNHSLDPSVITVHADHLVSLFRHPSYACVKGRPLFAVYAPYDIHDVGRFVQTYREAFAQRGFSPLIGFCVPYVDPAFDARHFDFSLEFQPRLFFNVMRAKRQTEAARVGLLLKRRLPKLYDALTGWRDKALRHRSVASSGFEYRDYLELVNRDFFGRLLEESFGIPAVRCAFYSWNNFPRYRGSALVVRHGEGDFKEFMSLCATMVSRYPWSLVNSWNEWSEGAALEPGVMDCGSYDLHSR